MQVGDEEYHEEYSVLFGFEFGRTFMVPRKLSVAFDTNSFTKDIILKQGKYAFYGKYNWLLIPSE